MNESGFARSLETAEFFFKTSASWLALSVEIVACLIIAAAMVESAAAIFSLKREPGHPLHRRKEVFLRFGSWLILALEFELAADIIRSAIAPSWEQIGMLGAIAVIRTFLNFFLERDVEKLAEGETADPEAKRSE
jgi:uncharacterized membrane protein